MYNTEIRLETENEGKRDREVGEVGEGCKRRGKGK